MSHKCNPCNYHMDHNLKRDKKTSTNSIGTLSYLTRNYGGAPSLRRLSYEGIKIFWDMIQIQNYLKQ